MKAIFLDRDSTVNVGVPKYQWVDSVDKVELLPNSLEALSILATLDFGLFFITNQLGIAEGLISESDFNDINNRVLEMISISGAEVIKTYVCPHSLEDNCDCRKPRPKLLLDAARDYDIDLKSSYMIGDRQTDVQAGVNAGTKAILVKTGLPDMASPEADYIAKDLLDAAQYIKSRA